MTGHDGGVAAHARAVLTTLDRARVELGGLDRAVYDAVSSTPSPTIDRAVARISNAANHSKLWMVTAGLLGATGPTRRRAALIGLTAVGATSAVSNLVVKPVMSRRRPERTDSVRNRGVRMPQSHSFPSGHTASAFAFSSAVGGELPALATPLRLMATSVAYSRVHTGVHYPGDVIIGALLGAGIGTTTRLLAHRGGWAVVSGR